MQPRGGGHPAAGRGLMPIRKAASACRHERVGQRNRFTVQLARA